MNTKKRIFEYLGYKSEYFFIMHYKAIALCTQNQMKRLVSHSFLQARMTLNGNYSEEGSILS